MMLEIEQLILRIPNVSPEEGRQLSRQIVERLADQLPMHSQSLNIESMDLSIRLSDQMSGNQLVNHISGAILSRVNNVRNLSRTRQSATYFLTSNEGSH